MTDTTTTLSDKQLADNVREAARRLGEAWARELKSVWAQATSVRVRRITAEVL